MWFYYQISTIGWLVIVKLIFRFISALFEAFFFRNNSYSKIYGQNSWAVVTGASQGIGWEFCRQLARRGINCVLISRTASTLQKRCDELMKEFPGIKAEYLTADFMTDTSVEMYEKIAKDLEDKDVSILINNVGAFATKILRSSKQALRDAIICNSLPQVMMTKVLTDRMLNREKKSAIFNISSLGAHVPNGAQPPYHSSKTFGGMTSKAESLNFGDKIDYSSCFPMYVATGMVPDRKVDLVTCTGEECTARFINLHGRTIRGWSFGHYKHQIFSMSLEIMKNVIGWKNTLKIGYVWLRLIQRIQYKKKVDKECTIKTAEEYNVFLNTFYWVREKTPKFSPRLLLARIQNSPASSIQKSSPNSDKKEKVETENDSSSNLNTVTGDCNKNPLGNFGYFGGNVDLFETPSWRVMSNSTPDITNNSIFFLIKFFRFKFAIE